MVGRPPDSILVPDDKEVEQLISHEFHDAAYAGHLGILTVVKNIQLYLAYWAETLSTETETFKL